MKPILIIALIGVSILFVSPVAATTVNGYISSDTSWYAIGGACATPANCAWTASSGQLVNTGPGAGNIEYDLVAPIANSMVGDWSVQTTWTLTRAVVPATSNSGSCTTNLGLRECDGGIIVSIAGSTSVGGTEGWGNANGQYNTNPTDSFVSSFACGFMAVPDTGGSQSGIIVVQFTKATNTATIQDGLHSCTSVNANYATFNKISFSALDCFVGGTIGGKLNSCSVSLGTTVMNINDGHTFTITDTTGVQPAEFDTGLKATVSGLGFATPQSQFLFVLIMVALGTILASAATAFFGDGRGRIWMIHGFACLIGIFAVLLSFMQLWSYSLALILGTISSRGGAEFINTYRQLAAYRKTKPITEANTVEPGSDLNPNPVTFDREQYDSPIGPEPAQPTEPEAQEPQSESTPEPVESEDSIDEAEVYGE